MDAKRRNRGFTLIETLGVVALITILMGVSFVAVINRQRSLKRLELDETARELFVAAQNHLSMAQAQGIITKATDKGEEDQDASDVVYYYCVDGENDTKLVNPSSILNQMLPQFSIDDTVRRGGRYIISYNPKTATVLNVFYSDRSDLSNYAFVKDDYGPLMSGYAGNDKTENRQDGYNDAIIGWYGGDGLESRELKDLFAPTLRVENDECLSAILTLAETDYWTNAKCSDVKVQLIMEGDESGSKRLVKEFALIDFLGQTQEVILDDITAQPAAYTNKGQHFSELWCSSTDEDAQNLIPGEDITLYARVYTNKELAKPAKSNTKHTNSLFASVVDEEGKVANITDIRHLENLDKAISGYDPTVLGDEFAYVARQRSDLQWKGKSEAFLERILANKARTGSETKTSEVKVYYLNTGTAPTTGGTFAPINPTYKLEYDGGNHAIANVEESVAGAAGLFGTLDQEGSSVANLKLIDFKIASSEGAAGSLAGTITGEGIKVSNVVAYNSSNKVVKSASAITGATAAGGLIGTTSGTKIVESAAAMYVEATGSASNAGGLVGETTDGSITKSYAAGHLVEQPANSKEDETAKTMVYSPTAGNVVAGTSGVAGGLVGKANTTPISYGYSTCSAFVTGTTDAPGIAGGLVGTASDAKISHCYATGLLGNSGKEPTDENYLEGVTFGAFVGTNSGATFEDDSYLAVTNEVRGVRAVSSDTDANKAEGIVVADDETERYQEFASGKNKAKPYAAALKSYYKEKYPYKTADELMDKTATSGKTVSAMHYGDWPTPETLVLNTKAGSEAALYRIDANREGPYYVYDSDVTLTLKVSDDNGETYKPYVGPVEWESGNDYIAVSGTTADATLSFAQAGTATITATVEGGSAQIEITVIERTTPSTGELVPKITNQDVDHADGYLAFREMNSITVNNTSGEIIWREFTEGSNTYDALESTLGYTLVYYDGTYYKPVDASGNDNCTTLENFSIAKLLSGELYHDGSREIRWVAITDVPTNVPASDSGPGTRDMQTTDTSDWNYRADRWLSNNGTWYLPNVEWEPFRDGCMVAVYHSGGEETIGAVWCDGKYYVPLDVSSGSDTMVPILQTGFTSADLDGNEHTYAGNSNQKTVRWLEVPSPYNQGTVDSADNPPTDGATMTSEERSKSSLLGWDGPSWVQYRDGCFLAVDDSDVTHSWANVYLIWHEGSYYQLTSASGNEINMRVPNLHHYFYTSHLEDGQAHDYAGTSVTWRKV